jgi:hypothetical protein
MGDLYDPSIFTAGDAALDLLGNAIRKAMATNIFGGKTKFVARALEDEYTLNALEARGVANSSTEGGRGESVAFRARIIGEHSPHDFIPDPCDPAIAVDKQHVSQLISMHTLFVDSDQTERDPVTRGDIVYVELDPAYFGFSYNLEYGKFLKVVSVETPPSATGQECSSLKNLF